MARGVGVVGWHAAPLLPHQQGHHHHRPRERRSLLYVTMTSQRVTHVAPPLAPPLLHWVNAKVTTLRINAHTCPVGRTPPRPPSPPPVTDLSHRQTHPTPTKLITTPLGVTSQVMVVNSVWATAAAKCPWTPPPSVSQPSRPAFNALGMSGGGGAMLCPAAGWVLSQPKHPDTTDKVTTPTWLEQRSAPTCWLLTTIPRTR